MRTALGQGPAPLGAADVRGRQGLPDLHPVARPQQGVERGGVPDRLTVLVQDVEAVQPHVGGGAFQEVPAHQADAGHGLPAVVGVGPLELAPNQFDPLVPGVPDQDVFQVDHPVLVHVLLTDREVGDQGLVARRAGRGTGVVVDDLVVRRAGGRRQEQGGEPQTRQEVPAVEEGQMREHGEPRDRGTNARITQNFLSSRAEIKKTMIVVVEKIDLIS